MTTDYIEIIRKSPYYYQVDGALLENRLPSTIKNDDLWEEWKDNLPDHGEKEKVFLDIVRRMDLSSTQVVETLSFMEVVKKNPLTIKDIYENERRHLIIPRMEYWELVRHVMNEQETLPVYYLRVALEHYQDDWTATVQCFRNLLMGCILLGCDHYQEHKCFIQGTPVWTLDGIKPIEKVQIGDQVSTHNGRFSRVISTFQNKKGERMLCNVYGIYGKIATCTTDHRFLVYSKEHDRIVWKQAKELTENDYLLKAFQHTTLSFIPLLFENPAISSILNNFPRIAGMSMSLFNGNHGKVDIDTDACKKHIEEHNYNIYQDLIMLLSCVQMRIKIWKWVLTTNQRSFVEGWMDVFEGQTWFQIEEEAKWVGMILSLHHYDVEVVKSFLCSTWWCIRQRRPSSQQHVWKTCGMEFVRFVKTTRHYKYHTHVYTLEVENDHSYNVNGYIVKNCTGLTKDTFLLNQEGLVPVVSLREGDYLLDENYNKTRIRSITRMHYQGKVVSIDNHGHTFHTVLYQDRIMRPDISYYYNVDIDKQFSNNYLRFLIGYLTEWKSKEVNGWSFWETMTLSDHMLLTNVFLKNMYSFQYHISNMTVSIQTNALQSFVSKCISNLLFLSVEKLKYFFSCLDRTDPMMWRLHSTEQCFVDTLSSLVQGKKKLKSCNYVGDIYNIEVETGDGFYAVHALLGSHRKMSLSEWKPGCGASHLYISDSFFHKNFSNERWEEILHSQWTEGKPSLVFVDRNKNECVSGDTRILTQHGIIPIALKKDEMVPVWNGTDFVEVMVAQTGQEKKFLKLHFSNGMSLTCTPYHKFFIKAKDNNIVKVDASHIKCGNELASYQLPSIMSSKIPSSVMMTLEWIAKRSVYIENNIVLFDRDVESLRDILLDLQCCGIKSLISYNTFRNEYELKIEKARWNQLNYYNLHPTEPLYIEGDVIDSIRVEKIEESSKYQNSFCFQEKFSGTAIFEGVATGQCENMMSIFCAQGHLDLSTFLVTNPMQKQITNMVVYTSSDCPFVRLLQYFYHGKMDVRVIDVFRDEWEQKRHTHALSSVPAIFIDNFYVGDFIDVWGSYLCPILDIETLKYCVHTLCRGLDTSIDRDNGINAAVLSSRSLLLNISGFHDVLTAMKLTPNDPMAKSLNSSIFETIYYTALKTSMELSIEKGCCSDSNKIVSMMTNSIGNDVLCRDLNMYGVRNMIYLKTWNTKRRDKWWEEDKKALHLEKEEIEIPNYLKQVYQDNNLPYSEIVEMMIDRKAYHVLDHTLSISLNKVVDKDTFKKVIQRAWSGGFHKVEIRS